MSIDVLFSPANISVREQTYAGTDDDWSWQFYIGGLSSPTITRNIDDGFGDPITSVNWYLSPCYEDYSSAGVHITPYQVTVVDPPQICPYDGNTYTGIVTLSTRQVSDKISASGNLSNYDVQVSAGWYDAISADTRAVIINQPQTTKKEVVTNGSPDGGILFDSDGDPLLVMPPPNNTADADGTMYGDIGIPDGEYAYEFGPGYGETLQPQQDSLKVKYEAALTGSWSANPITFAWSSNLGSTEFVPPPQPTVPVFWDQYWGAEISMDGSKVQDWGDTEKTATIKVAATDPADGATATGMYKMTIHREHEVLPSNRPTTVQSGLNSGDPIKAFERATITKYVTNPPYAMDGGFVTVEISAPDGLYEYGSGALTILAGATAFVPELWPVSMGCLICGVGLDWTKPADFEYQIFFDSCWAENVGDNGPGMPVSTFTLYTGVTYTGHNSATKLLDYQLSSDKTDWRMYPNVWQAYFPTFFLDDAYGSSGFIGETKFSIWTPKEGAFYWGSFRQSHPK